MRTTPTEPEWFQPLEDVISGELCLALFGTKADSQLRDRLALPCRHGGMGMPRPCQLAKEEYDASLRVSKPLRELMKQGETQPGWLEAVSSKKESRKIRDERDKANDALFEAVSNRLHGRALAHMLDAKGRGRSGVLTTVPTKWSGTTMPALWWRTMAQMRLGLFQQIQLPAQCPDCGHTNSIDHALGAGERGGCGGARIECHNEIGIFAKKLASEAGFHVPQRKEPKVGFIPGEEDGEKAIRCDGIIRGLKTFHRDTWVLRIVW